MKAAVVQCGKISALSIDDTDPGQELLSMKRSHAGRLGISGTLILGLLALLTACTTVTTEVRTGVEENWRYTVKEPRRDTSPKGPVAELSYRGREILPYFTTVVVGERVFDYQIRIDRGDFRGYRMAEEGAADTDRRTADAITQEELEDGWYFASREARKPGTPETWVWVRRLNVEAFVAPEKISRLADSLDLYPVDGNTEDAPRSGVSLGIRFTTVF